MDAAITARGLARLMRTVQEERAEERLYGLWLHKVHDGSSYNEYRRRVEYSARNATMTDEQQARVIGRTKDILSRFDPEGGEQ